MTWIHRNSDIVEAFAFWFIGHCLRIWWNWREDRKWARIGQAIWM